MEINLVDNKGPAKMAVVRFAVGKEKLGARAVVGCGG
jgi:hypothetical protein